MVDRQVDLLQKERTKAICPPVSLEEFPKVHCEQQIDQNGALPSIEEDSSLCVVASSTTDDNSNMETEVLLHLNLTSTVFNLRIILQ